MCMLATVSMLMAAKLEQPISPSFSRMIGLLTDEEQLNVSKSGLIQLESDILVVMNFDFNFPGPI
jgi:phosphohistidine swiveling domain-containing protein